LFLPHLSNTASALADSGMTSFVSFMAERAQEAQTSVRVDVEGLESQSQLV
jgi:hypothetical protein